MIVYAGVDYSITSPAICLFDGKEFSFKNCQFFYLTNVKKSIVDTKTIHGELHKSYSCEEERFDVISNWAMDILSFSFLTCVEGYSFGSTGRVFTIAENTGLLKHKLWTNETPFEIIPPTVIKKFATGKGNISKIGMYEAFFEETQFNLKSLLSETEKQSNPSSDIVDAYYICKYIFTKKTS